MKEIYCGRQGPKIRKTDDETFMGQESLTKEKGKLYARYFVAEDNEKVELEAYLRKY